MMQIKNPALVASTTGVNGDDNDILFFFTTSRRQMKMETACNVEHWNNLILLAPMMSSVVGECQYPRHVHRMEV